MTSTNNRSAGGGLGVVLILAGLIFSMDLGIRAIDHALSGNIAHIQHIPAIIGRAAASGQDAVLFLGNSLTNNGVATDVVETALPGTHVAKITPDGTAYWDWQCLLEHQVLTKQDVRIRIIVIGYAWHLLSDQTRADASRLGAHFCRLSDLKNPNDIGLRNIGDVAEFALSRALRIYALRDALRNRGLALLVPGYEKFVQDANAARAGGGAASAPNAAYTYERLRRLAARLQERDIQLVVVAMPIQGEYDLDDGLRALAEEKRLLLLDYRRVEGIDASSYLDSMHLNRRGQKVLSERLASALNSIQVAAR